MTNSIFLALETLSVNIAPQTGCFMSDFFSVWLWCDVLQLQVDWSGTSKEYMQQVVQEAMLVALPTPLKCMKVELGHRRNSLTLKIYRGGKQKRQDSPVFKVYIFGWTTTAHISPFENTQQNRSDENNFAQWKYTTMANRSFFLSFYISVLV